jgi:acetolactate synthase-1/2/3 large subunit
MDYRAFFGSTAKWATQIDVAARIPEMISRAFHVAMQGRPGPVVIALPEDMLLVRAEVDDAPRVEPVAIWPGLAQTRALKGLICAAERPVVIVGGSGWNERGATAITHFAEHFDLPVIASFRRTTVIPNDHPCYAGELGIGANPKLRERVEAADLVLLIGGRMGEIPSQGYRLFDIPKPRQTLAHVHADSGEIGRVYHPDLGIVATLNEFAAVLEKLHPPARIRWSAETADAHESYLDWTKGPACEPGDVRLSEIMTWLRDRLSGDTIVTNGAGNFALWVGRYLRFRQFGTHLGPVSGSMGYGLPAAVAAKRLHPERPVVCFCGDGDFLMNGQEFATAVQYELPIVVIVLDNGMYGAIRMHQERSYPGRNCATTLRNPDFAAYARAFGGHGETVARTMDFAAAYERCRDVLKPSIIHVKLDPEAITPTSTLSAVRASAET